MNQTLAKVWVKIHGISQEYWRPRIIFAIAGSLGTLIYIDSISKVTQDELLNSADKSNQVIDPDNVVQSNDELDKNIGKQN